MKATDLTNTATTTVWTKDCDDAYYGDYWYTYYALQTSWSVGYWSVVVTMKNTRDSTVVTSSSVTRCIQNIPGAPTFIGPAV